MGMHGEQTETPQQVKKRQAAQTPNICGCRKTGVKSPRVVQRSSQQQSGAIIESADKSQSGATRTVSSKSSAPQLVEGASQHVSHGEFRFVVPFMINGDRIFARKFVTVDDALAFALSDTAIAAWTAAHPDDDGIIGKIIECY
jgi:hypothetical protein